MGANLIILEEAAYIDAYTMVNVIFPIMDLTSTATVGISTASADQSNTYHRMQQSKHFTVLSISYVCPPCQERGVTEICKHRRAWRPAWIEEGSTVAQAVLGKDDPDFIRESLNIRASADPACFPEHIVMAMMSAPRCTLYEPVRFIYLNFDPAAGSDVAKGHTSDFALVSSCEPGCTILGMEAIDVVHPNDYSDRVRTHLRRLRELPYCGNAVFVVDVESGTGLEASHVLAICMEAGRVIPMRDFQRKDGTRIDNKLKQAMMILAREYMESGRIRFHRNLVTTNPNPDAMMKELTRQLLAYQRHVVVSNSMRTANTVVFSGKGPSKSKRDDLAVMLQKAPIMQRKFNTEEQYRQHRY